MINPNLSLGVTVYGNGGMNTSYEKGNTLSAAGVCGSAPTNPLCGSGKLGVNLEQLIIAPTLAYKVAPNHSLGISPLLAYQRFSADGLQAFMQISSAPNNLTNRGHDSATGYGVRIGWQGRISDSITVALDYQRINNGKVPAIANSSRQPGCTGAPPAGPGVGSACLGGTETLKMYQDSMGIAYSMKF